MKVVMAAPAAGLSSVTEAEIGRDDCDLVTVVHAWGARGVHGSKADLAPAPVEQVFAGRPLAVAAIGVEARDPFEERAAVGRVVAEVALLRHRLGVLVRRRRQGCRETKRAEAVPPARQVDLTEQLRLERGEMHARRRNARSLLRSLRALRGLVCGCEADRCCREACKYRVHGSDIGRTPKSS